MFVVYLWKIYKDVNISMHKCPFLRLFFGTLYIKWKSARLWCVAWWCYDHRSYSRHRMLTRVTKRGGRGKCANKVKRHRRWWWQYDDYGGEFHFKEPWMNLLVRSLSVISVVINGAFQPLTGFKGRTVAMGGVDTSRFAILPTVQIALKNI